MLLVWVIGAIPLAIINELRGRGAIQASVYNVTLTLTMLVAYIGLLFIRIFPMAMIPAMYSGSQRPAPAAFSFAGRNFFKLAKFFLITDAIQFFMSSLYNSIGKSLIILFINSILTTTIIFFLFYVIFDTYAADGYGYDELDGYTGAYAPAQKPGRTPRDTAPTDGFEVVNRSGK